MPEKLAIDGGKPVRTTPFPTAKRWGAHPEFPGASIIGKEEEKAVVEVIRSQSLFRYYGSNLLNKVSQFEKEFENLMGIKHAQAVTSGTAALNTGLAALGVGPGDEVIVPAYTFVASPEAVAAQKAIPVFAEIDYSLGLDPEDLKKKITKYTKAIMPVHLGGAPSKMDTIMEIAENHDLLVIEDCAQDIGGKYKGKRVGTIGDVGAFSLQLHKNITTGDGGIVATDDDKIYERVARYQDHGNFRGKVGGGEDDEAFIGQVYRMNELTGAVALEQLKKLDKIIELMKRPYFRIIKEIKDVHGLRMREIEDESGISASDVTIFVEDPDKAERFSGALKAEGIPVGLRYQGKPVYALPQIMNMRTTTDVGCPWKCPLYKGKVKYKMGLCPKTEDIAKRTFNIGMNPLFTDQDADDIIHAIKKVVENLL